MTGDELDDLLERMFDGVVPVIVILAVIAGMLLLVWLLAEGLLS